MAAGNDSPGVADTTARIVASAKTIGGSHVVIGTAGPAAVTATTGGVAVTVAHDPAGGVRLTSSAADGAVVTVGLPTELALSAAQVADDGTVVYPAAHGDAAVQAQSDGTVAIHSVLQDKSAPTRFTYAFSGARLVALDDGSVLLVDPVSPATVIGAIAPGWAVDAAGAPVRTSYLVHGNTLVQVVYPDASTTYPVVADPSVSFGWKVYVTFNRTEVHTIANSPLTPKAKYAAIICAVVPVPWIAAACGLLTYDIADSIANTFATASRQNQCVQIGYPYTWGGLPQSWVILSC